MLPRPSKLSATSLEQYEFLGRIIGVAMRRGICLPLRLPSLVWKQLIEQPLATSDLADVDESFILSMDRLLEVRPSYHVSTVGRAATNAVHLREPGG